MTFGQRHSCYPVLYVLFFCFQSLNLAMLAMQLDTWHTDMTVVSSHVTHIMQERKHISQKCQTFPLTTFRVCRDVSNIAEGFDHTARALAVVKWNMLHFYGKSIMFVFTPNAITMSLFSHSLHFHVWEGETGWGFGSKKSKSQGLLWVG